MEMHLQPPATACHVTGEAFGDGMRVASYLVRSGGALDIVRYDMLEQHATDFVPPGFVACKWVHAFKPRRIGDNPDRALKLTAETLFLALADPTTEPTPENTRLVQFLTLMLERKRILRPKGRTLDGERNRFEHAKTKAIYEVPAGELTSEFFIAVQEQLSVLVGSPGPKAGTATTGTAIVAAGTTDAVTTDVVRMDPATIGASPSVDADETRPKSGVPGPVESMPTAER